MNKKLALICGEWAIRGGYIAWWFLALKEYPSIWNEISDFTATSASVGGLFYEFCFGNLNPGKKLWTEDFSDPRLINLTNLFWSNKSVYDIDYLIDVIFKERNPCNITNILHTHQWYYFPLINYDNGKTTVFNNKIEYDDWDIEFRLLDTKKLYLYIKAAIAAPILYDKVIIINGTRYIDAGIRHPIFINEKIFWDHKKIIISSKQPTTFQEILSYKIIALLYGHFGNLEKKYYQEMSEKYKIYKNHMYNKKSKNTFFIYPSKKLGSHFDNRKSTLVKNFELGRKDVLVLIDSIIAFMKE